MVPSPLLRSRVSPGSAHSGGGGDECQALLKRAVRLLHEDLICLLMEKVAVIVVPDDGDVEEAGGGACGVGRR